MHSCANTGNIFSVESTMERHLALALIVAMLSGYLSDVSAEKTGLKIAAIKPGPQQDWTKYQGKNRVTTSDPPQSTPIINNLVQVCACKSTSPSFLWEQRATLSCTEYVGKHCCLFFNSSLFGICPDVGNDPRSESFLFQLNLTQQIMCRTPPAI